MKFETGGWSLIGAAVLLCSPVARAETPAGTAVVNVAQLTRVAGGQTVTQSSNESRLIVAERLDVTLAAGSVAATTDGGTVAAAILTNTGNGREVFALSAAASGGEAASIGLVIDGDGDGRFDPARDPAIADGRTPVLTPGQAVTIFVIANGGPVSGMTLTATATTGSGVTGTGFAGVGDGGGDAVTGPTGASATVTFAGSAAASDAPTLVKTATVAAPDGSARAVSGATITYTLVARFPAATQAAQITDPIPAGTAYAPASLSLDDTPLTDAPDADAGDGAPTRISVLLGDQPAGAVRTVRFKVIIQ